jgi:hypothetical protein
MKPSNPYCEKQSMNETTVLLNHFPARRQASNVGSRWQCHPFSSYQLWTSGLQEGRPLAIREMCKNTESKRSRVNHWHNNQSLMMHKSSFRTIRGWVEEIKTARWQEDLHGTPSLQNWKGLCIASRPLSPSTHEMEQTVPHQRQIELCTLKIPYTLGGPRLWISSNRHNWYCCTTIITLFSDLPCSFLKSRSRSKGSSLAMIATQEWLKYPSVPS